MTEEIDEDYASWEGELEGKPRTTPVNQCGCGFFRLRTKNGLEPVGIWRDDDGDLVGHVGGEEETLADAEFAERHYSRAKAIPEQAYRDHIDGKGWPEDVNPHADQPNSDGSELAPDAEIREQIENLKRDAERKIKALKGGKIATKLEADQIANIGVAIGELIKKAEALRVNAVRPHLEGQRLENARWQPIVKFGETAKAVCSKVVTIWNAAEKARLAAEVAAKAAAGESVRASDLTVKAGTGKGMVNRTQKMLVFSDLEAAKSHYIADPRLRDHLLYLDVVRAMARADLTAGLKVPGAAFETEQKAS